MKWGNGFYWKVIVMVVFRGINLVNGSNFYFWKFLLFINFLKVYYRIREYYKGRFERFLGGWGSGFRMLVDVSFFLSFKL